MEAILKEGLAQLGLDTGSIPALTEFSRRLLEKNQVMNLTAITEPATWRGCTCWTAPAC